METGTAKQNLSERKRRLNDVTPEEWNASHASWLHSQSYDDTIPEQTYYADEPNFTQDKLSIPYKYNEDNLIAEFKRYVDSTYGEHYSRDKFQATEFIIDGGHGTGFCIGNVLKYAQRYGKKGTPKDARKDLMKVLHYALIQLYIHDTENN